MERGDYGVPLAPCDCKEKCVAWKAQDKCPSYMARTATMTVQPCKKCGPTLHRYGVCQLCKQ